MSPRSAVCIISVCQADTVKHRNTYMLVLTEPVMCSGKDSDRQEGATPVTPRHAANHPVVDEAFRQLAFSSDHFSKAAQLT